MTNGASRRISNPLAWFKQPSSWLSLAAAVVSVSTFFLVYANPGRLQIILPEEVGLAFNRDSTLTLYVPVTLSNSGAPRTSRHVVKMVAVVEDASPADGVSGHHTLWWRFEHVFVGKDAYLLKYPDKAGVGTRDYLDYRGRTFPFAISGGMSIGKIVEFYQPSGKADSSVNGFGLTLTVHTTDSSTKASGWYSCGADPLPTKTIQWCQREE